jgi:hypothetical protein
VCFRHSQRKVLGCLVSTKGIEANPDKIKALVEMQDPVSMKDVQKLTGRVVALNRFIPRAAERSLPFFQVLRSAKNFQWSETQKQAFQELKDYLSNMRKLCPPEPRLPLLLYVSASNSAVSIVLVQERKKRESSNKFHYISLLKPCLAQKSFIQSWKRLHMQSLWLRGN